MSKKPRAKPKRPVSSNKMHETAEKFTDPFLLDAGTSVGNIYRTRRAIIRLEQEDLENQDRIRTLKLENEKLKTKIKRLQEQAGLTERMEQRFEQLSSIILQSNFLGEDSSEEEEYEEEKDPNPNLTT